MRTEDKNPGHLRVRIAVLGRCNVGKSALTVRYLTKRFIGEYRSNTDLLYRQVVNINNASLEAEIIDVSNGPSDTTFPLEQVQWADACVVVYSITDKSSFQYALEALENLQKIRTVNNMPVVLLGNKSDLEHLREVEEVEGRTTAIQAGCHFFEVSVAENSFEVFQAFEYLITECRNLNSVQKTRKFSVSKMFGTLIGKNSPPVTQSGTVTVCNKSDLHRQSVIKRRQTSPPALSL